MTDTDYVYQKNFIYTSLINIISGRSKCQMKVDCLSHGLYPLYRRSKMLLPRVWLGLWWTESPRQCFSGFRRNLTSQCRMIVNCEPNVRSATTLSNSSLLLPSQDVIILTLLTLSPLSSCFTTPSQSRQVLVAPSRKSQLWLYKFFAWSSWSMARWTKYLSCLPLSFTSLRNLHFFKFSHLMCLADDFTWSSQVMVVQRGLVKSLGCHKRLCLRSSLQNPILTLSDDVLLSL